MPRTNKGALRLRPMLFFVFLSNQALSGRHPQRLITGRTTGRTTGRLPTGIIMTTISTPITITPLTIITISSILILFGRGTIPTPWR